MQHAGMIKNNRQRYNLIEYIGKSIILALLFPLKYSDFLFPTEDYATFQLVDLGVLWCMLIGQWRLMLL